MNETLSQILTGVAVLYVAWATFYGIKIVRGSLMNWYNSQAFFVAGKGPVDIFLKQIGFRIGWEIFVLFASAVVGSLGGAIYMVFIQAKQPSTSNSAE